MYIFVRNLKKKKKARTITKLKSPAEVFFIKYFLIWAKNTLFIYIYIYSGISVLMAPQDDDIYIYIYMCVCVCVCVCVFKAYI